MAALPSLATSNDLGDWLGATIEQSDVRAGAVLAAASSLVRAEAQTTWIDATTGALGEVPDVIVTVVVQAAARGYRNPDGLQSETIDDYTRRLSPAASAGVYLTDDERAIARRFRPNRTSGLWSLSTTREAVDSTIYVSTDAPGADPLPWLNPGMLP